MTLHRRSILQGLASAVLCSGARAEKPSSPLAHGVLANNRLAQSFEPVKTEWPDVPLIGPEGEFTLDKYKGRTLLVPLWAEWCAPCLSELPDFARLQKKYGNDKFMVLPIVSGTSRKMTPEAITDVFKILHAEALMPVVEKRFGNRLVASLARNGSGYAIPCNLLIAPDGRVVGREIGRETADDASEGAAPAKTKDAETVTRAIHGQAQSAWGKPEGEEFAKAMAAGFLSA